MPCVPIRPLLFPLTRKKEIAHALGGDEGIVDEEEAVDQNLALNGGEVIGVASDARDAESGVL